MDKVVKHKLDNDKPANWPRCLLTLRNTSARFLSLVVISATVAIAGAGEYSVRSWGLQEGLPEGNIQAIAQTQDGYLWIGTSGGLVRFDGVRFIVYNSFSTPEFADESVLSLCVTNDGALWVGTEGGGLYRYSQGKFRGFGHSDGLTNLFVRTMYEDSTQRLWIGTDQGIFRLARDGSLVRVDAQNGSPIATAVAIYQDRTGEFGLVADRAVHSIGRMNSSFILPGI